MPQQKELRVKRHREQKALRRKERLGPILEDLEVVSPAEASRIVGLSVETLANRRKLGLPPTWSRSGKRSIVYRIRDLIDFLRPEGEMIRG
jgi:hypothetical protein